MSAYALLIATTKGTRTLIADGDPRDIRSKFKVTDCKGIDRLEVIETGNGRTRSRQFKQPSAKPAPPQPSGKASK